MRRSFASVLGLASFAFALVTGPITHVHPGVDGHGPLQHAHFLAGHSPHPHSGVAVVDDDDDHLRASYVNPYVSVGAPAGVPGTALEPVVAHVAPPALAVYAVAAPPSQAHGPPSVGVRLHRGPPVRPTSA